jgi:MFS superfamily sulfate permease-like transporter
MSESKTTVKGGLGFWSALQLALIILKLTGIIKWSWWVVLFPLWGDIFLIILLTVTFIIACIPTKEEREMRKKRRLKNAN